MNNIPFKRFIILFLFLNESLSQIVDRLKKFGCYTTESEVKGVFYEILEILPENMANILREKSTLDINDDKQIQWLKHYGIFEFYDYLQRKNQGLDEPPAYFKWCNDCMWIHQYKDVVALINIFLYNNEPLESISKIISFKYRKKIGIDALKLYQSVFWDCAYMSAKDALYYCLPFRNNTVILRTLRNGEKEIEGIQDDLPSFKRIEADDGCDVQVTFHDVKYIKWKIGYREDVEAPSIKDFMEKVKLDSMYKYEEVMMMTDSSEREEDEGIVSSAEGGSMPVEGKKRRFRNVEEQRAKLAKSWVDMVIKADSAIPSDGSNESKKFLEDMKQFELDFTGEKEEKIVDINDAKDMMLDIKGDM
jgi:hypothetical protein